MGKYNLKKSDSENFESLSDDQIIKYTEIFINN